MNIVYVTTYDATDVHQWSGTPFNMAGALRATDANVHYVGNLKERFSLAFKGRQFMTRKVLGKNYLRHRSYTITAGYAHQIERRLARIPADIILSPSTIPVCRVETDKPIVTWTDATFAGMIDFYPAFSNLHPQTVRDGNDAEQAALDRCALAIYSSDWAARSAIEHYSVDPKKVRVVPFGANLDFLPSPEQVRMAISARSSRICKLLFIGVEWERKGGDVALRVVQELNEQGIPAELTLVGSAPDAPQSLPDYVKILGFVSKATVQGREKFAQILLDSHFLIIPSQADCSPIVLNEANAFGVPCLTTDVGGIPSIITNDVNGYAFPREASYSDYCTYVGRLMQHYAAYQDLAHSAYDEYERRLNWCVSGRIVRQLLADVLQRPA